MKIDLSVLIIINHKPHLPIYQIGFMSDLIDFVTDVQNTVLTKELICSNEYWLTKSVIFFFNQEICANTDFVSGCVPIYKCMFTGRNTWLGKMITWVIRCLSVRENISTVCNTVEFVSMAVFGCSPVAHGLMTPVTWEGKGQGCSFEANLNYILTLLNWFKMTQ